MRSATRSADMPGPGRRFGHEVTMRQRFVCARATDGAAIAPARPSRRRRATRLRRVKRVMLCLLPPGVKVMRRPVPLPDLELVGRRDRVGHVSSWRRATASESR